jgi:hypothetical protein
MKHPLLMIVLGAGLAFAGINCAPQDDAPPRSLTRVETSVKKAAPELPEALKPRIDAALTEVHSRDLRTDNGFWTIFHGILGMGPDTRLFNPATGTRVNALDEICRGADIRGLSFRPTANGVDVETMIGSGVGQGHQDQFIAEMAQWGMPRERKFSIAGKSYTFEDFIRHSKMHASVTHQQELSWAVLIVSEYYGTDHRWTNEYGEPVTLEDVLRYEVRAPIDSAACGGTHRLFGITWALHRHLEKGGKKEGVWQEAANHIEEYKQNALRFQNGDGSFSSAYVSKPGSSPDLQARIGSTGHVLEWLALAMTADELRSEKMQHAASALAAMILSNQNSPLDGGSLYHATHGLHIYRTRLFGTPPPRGLLMPLPKSEIKG